MLCLCHVILFCTHMSSCRNAQANVSVMKEPKWGPTDGWVSIANSWQGFESWRMISLTCCTSHANKDSTAIKRADLSLESLWIAVNSVYLEKWLQILMGSENHKSKCMCPETSQPTGSNLGNWIFNNCNYLVFFFLTIVSILNETTIIKRESVTFIGSI